MLADALRRIQGGPVITKVHSDIVGGILNGNTTRDFTLPQSFDTARTVVLFDPRYADQSDCRNNWRRVSVVNSTTIRLHRVGNSGDTADSGIVVIEFAKLKSLQYVSAAIGTASSGSATCSAVDTSRAFAVNAGCVDNSFSGSGWTYARGLCELSSSTTVFFDRSYGGGQGTDMTAYAWVVEV